MRVYSLLELAQLQDDPDRWLVPNLVAKASRVMIYGVGNVGKSWVSVDLAMAIAVGDLFMGHLAVGMPGPVLVISTEGDIYANRDRILGLANGHAVTDHAAVPFYFVQEAPQLDQADDRKMFYETIAHLRPRLVILDPLDSFFSGEENSASATKPIRFFLDRIIRDFGCCIMLLHHESQGNEKGGFKKPRGTTAWQGWLDTIIHARGLPGNALSLEVEKQRNGRKGMFYSLDMGIEVERGLVRLTPKGSQFDEGLAGYIVRLLSTCGSMSLTDLKTYTGRQGVVLMQALERLERSGQAIRYQQTFVSAAGTALSLPYFGWRSPLAPEPPAHITTH